VQNCASGGAESNRRLVFMSWKGRKKYRIVAGLPDAIFFIVMFK